MEILCPDVVVIFCNTSYCCKTTPNQYAKFARKSLLFNHLVLPVTHIRGVSYEKTFIICIPVCGDAGNDDTGSICL